MTPQLNDEYGYDNPEEYVELVVREEPVNPEQYVAVIHDSFGERYVNFQVLEARSPLVTVHRVLGAMDLEPKLSTKFYLDGNEVGVEHQITAGQSIYIVGKLAGGK